MQHGARPVGRWQRGQDSNLQAGSRACRRCLSPAAASQTVAGAAAARLRAQPLSHLGSPLYFLLSPQGSTGNLPSVAGSDPLSAGVLSVFSIGAAVLGCRGVTGAITRSRPWCQETSHIVFHTCGKLTKTGSEYNINPRLFNVKLFGKIKYQFVKFAEITKSLLYNFYRTVMELNRIKELRLSAGMKQADLAILLNCSPTAVSYYETGVRDIDSATINRLCDVFGCTADYLLGRSTVPEADLTPEEADLLLAWRRSDGRARDMVAVALAPFKQDASSSAAI